MSNCPPWGSAPVVKLFPQFPQFSVSPPRDPGSDPRSASSTCAGVGKKCLASKNWFICSPIHHYQCQNHDDLINTNTKLTGRWLSLCAEVLFSIASLYPRRHLLLLIDPANKDETWPNMAMNSLVWLTPWMDMMMRKIYGHVDDNNI